MARVYDRTSTYGLPNDTPPCTTYLNVEVSVWITRYMLWINKLRDGVHDRAPAFIMLCRAGCTPPSHSGPPFHYNGAIYRERKGGRMESRQLIGTALGCFLGAVLGMVIARMTVGPGIGAYVGIGLGVAVGVALGRALARL